MPFVEISYSFFKKTNLLFLLLMNFCRTCLLANGYKIWLCWDMHLLFVFLYMINASCRLQILRDLIPQSDQKRDKASFLSEACCFVWKWMLFYFWLSALYAAFFENLYRAGYQIYSVFAWEGSEIWVRIPRMESGKHKYIAMGKVASVAFLCPSLPCSTRLTLLMLSH